MGQLDIISGSYEAFIRWCEYLDQSMYSFMVRGALILLIPVALAKAAIEQGNTSRTVQGLVALVGLLLALSAPIPNLDHVPELKAWLLAICILVILSMPALLPRELISGLTIQKRAVWITYSVFLLLFLLELFGRGY